MLNISRQSVAKQVKQHNYSALNRVEKKVTSRVLVNLVRYGILIIAIVAFLPWTQNVRSSGTVTTLNPDQRPQTVHTIIPGRIEQWKIKEGDFVKKGDTIAFLSEIKDSYFDKKLLARTQNQIELKKQTVNVYAEKENAQNNQLQAIKEQLELSLKQTRIKYQQTEMKVQNDSIAYFAAKLNFKTAQLQYNRMDSLYRLGLKSLVDLEARRINQQKTQALEIAAKNDWLTSQTELLRLQLELSQLQAKYNNDYAKTLSERLTTSTSKFNTETDVNKLENQFSNYDQRQQYYVITAPQDGYITKAFVNGIGETLKEGQPVVSIMPQLYDLAAEIYVDPIDLPLMNLGEHVRIQFDGWPAIVFSGWPDASIGTYGGRIYAIDQYISPNGKFRILVEPDPNDEPWPHALRYGGGTKTMILLNDVAIWYELWRQINDFPPHYYTPKTSNGEDKK